jgi:DNA-binding PadR family transcriptional regulator
MRRRDWPDFRDFFGEGGRGFWGGFGGGFDGGPRRSRRGRWFESGEMRLVILRLIREKPRHGYEIMKALEERMGGCYTPSAGSVYPTLQMLEDQGYVRYVEEDGKKNYHITPEGERFLDENEDVLASIGERIQDALHGVVGGAMADVNSAFAQLSKRVFRDAWRSGPDSARTAKIAEILRRAAAEIEALGGRDRDPRE